eukprot:scaffold216418_cov14-Tisochrysis_lutea.AAC.1
MDSDDESGVAFQVRSKKRVSASCSCESWKGHWYEAGSASWVWEGVMAAFHGTIVASVSQHFRHSDTNLAVPNTSAWFVKSIRRVALLRGIKPMNAEPPASSCVVICFKGLCACMQAHARRLAACVKKEGSVLNADCLSAETQQHCQTASREKG